MKTASPPRDELTTNTLANVKGGRKMSALLILAVLFAPVILSSMMVEGSFEKATPHDSRH